MASNPAAVPSTDHAIGFGHEVPVERDQASVAWFSGTAKNVVQAYVFVLGFRLNLSLKSYHLG